jgi:hypothetical protein
MKNFSNWFLTKTSKKAWDFNPSEMKSTIFFFAFLATSFQVLHSQNLDGLKTEAKKIYDANYAMDFEGIVALTHPKVFETIDAKALSAKLDTDYQNAEFGKRLVYETPRFEFAPIKKIGSKSVCVIRYRNPIRYNYENALDAATIETKAAALKESLKAAKVTFEQKRNSFFVERVSVLIAIADASTGNTWRFIDLDESTQRSVAGQLFDAAAKKELGL